MNPGVRVVEGALSAQGLRVGIAASRFNNFIVERLVDGAIDALVRHGARAEDLRVAWCPGAFELPQVARWLVEAGDLDVVLVLGCVIRGATPHFDYVAGESAKGIGQLSLVGKVPLTYGILTTDTIEQAVERAGTKQGNKGFDAAMAGIELVALRRAILGGGAGVRGERG